MALRRLLGASRDTTAPKLMRMNVSFNTGMSNLFCIGIKVTVYFISDSGGQYGENLVGYLLFSKIRR